MAEPVSTPRARPGGAAPAVLAAAGGRGVPALLHALRSRRRAVGLGAYAVLTTVAYLAAFGIHFDLGWDRSANGVVVTSLLLLLTVRLITGHACGVGAQRWRFAGAGDVRRLVMAVAAGTALFVPPALAFGDVAPVPTRVLVLEPMLTLLLTAGLWLGYRTGWENVWRRGGGVRPVRRVVVVGAGEAGEALVRQMTRRPTGCRPVAFADDDASRRGTALHGIEVMGTTAELRRIASRTAADEVVIAIPSADPATLRRVVERCEATELPFRVLPGIAAVFNGEVSVSQLRELRIEDLLGREPVELELPELAEDLAGQVVLITGAAGSIGSELARQVARHRPGRLVLLDQSETGLFYLELELRDLTPAADIACVIADVVDAAAVERVFTAYRPGRVFHAAAYKHVPMMEANVREAVRNNVIGTWRVADAAGRHGAQKFILVSTDKAVRPANVMGATKRLAEILVLELQQEHPGSAFGAVRFGNVLGSAGSVVPIFKRQLEEGKPLTVTHPDVTRYFMTIPEATQLVLQASLLAELRGRIAMLEMGQPVRIVDLARSLVRLSGRSRGKEAIVFTGLRPGEKLHEELVAPGESVAATAVPKVWILHPDPDSVPTVLERMARWDRLLADWRPEPVLAEMRWLVPGLDPAAEADAGLAPVHDGPVQPGPALSPAALRDADAVEALRERAAAAGGDPYGEPAPAGDAAAPPAGLLHERRNREPRRASGLTGD